MSRLFGHLRANASLLCLVSSSLLLLFLSFSLAALLSALYSLGVQWPLVKVGAVTSQDLTEIKTTVARVTGLVSALAGTTLQLQLFLLSLKLLCPLERVHCQLPTFVSHNFLSQAGQGAGGGAGTVGKQFGVSSEPGESWSGCARQ